MRDDIALRKQVFGGRGTPFLAMPLLISDNAIGIIKVVVDNRDLLFKLDDRSLQYAPRRRSVRIILEDRNE